MDIAVHKNWGSHIDASHSRQPLVKGERLVRYEVNAVILSERGSCTPHFRAQQRAPRPLVSHWPLPHPTPRGSCNAAKAPRRRGLRGSALVRRGYPEGCVAHSSVPCQRNTRGAGQAQASSPNKNHVTSKSPVGDISVVTLIRTDTTLDHSQKAEKVCSAKVGAQVELEPLPANW